MLEIIASKCLVLLSFLTHVFLIIYLYPFTAIIVRMESSTRRRPLVIKPKFDRNNIYVLCGSAAVGKSCILRRFHDGVFSRHQKATIGGENFIEYLTDTYRATGAFRSKIMRVDGSLIQVQVWDTSGQERFQSICPIYYRKAQAAIIVYDISRYVSLVIVSHGVFFIYIISGNICRGQKVL